MRYQPDLTIRGADDSLVAVIEVKRAGEMTPERARGIVESYRRAVGGFPPAFFLVVSPGRGFLWKRDELRPDGMENAAFDFGAVLADYLDPDKDYPRARAVEYVVFHWLFDSAVGARTPSTEAERSLGEAGFIDAIRDARVSFGLAA